MKSMRLFVVCFTTISFLASCNNNSPKKCSVTFDSDGGTPVDSIIVDSGTIISEPEKPTKVDDVFNYDFQFWYKTTGEKKKFDFQNTPITEDITLKAEWEGTRKTYKASAVDQDILIYTSKDGYALENIPFDAGTDFIFNIKIGNQNKEYILPSMLDIHVAGISEPLSKNDYSIVGNEKEATVTINGSKTIGNITITGHAVETNTYNYTVSSHYGLEEIEDGTGYTASDKTLIFTPTESYKLPTSDDIYIYFDKADKWVKPSDNIASKYCSYNEETGALTIKASNENIENCIEITARANDYPVLENLSWNEISDISFSGKAPYIFRLGDKKTVTVNSQPHIVRIIGFNHDELADGSSKAGITFEFANLISDSNGYSLATIWDWSKGKESFNKDYINSGLRKAIDGGGEADTPIQWYQKGEDKHSDAFNDVSVFTMMNREPSNAELMSVLKEVNKPIAINTGTQDAPVWEMRKYNTQLFPLSYQEMTEVVLEKRAMKEEGPTYEFYKGKKGDTDLNRVKQQVKGAEGALSGYTEIHEDDKPWDLRSFAGFNYSSNPNFGSISWLRSPFTHSVDPWSVNYDGVMWCSYMIFDDAICVAPGFCV